MHTAGFHLDMLLLRKNVSCPKLRNLVTVAKNITPLPRFIPARLFLLSQDTICIFFFFLLNNLLQRLLLDFSVSD